jgi:DNA-binding MarR family transcriptional regulator
VRTFLIIPLVLMLAQKPVKKPEVHADFHFGSYPWSRQAADLLKDDLAREIVVAYSQGWSVDKIAKFFKITTSDVSKVSDKLEDERLVGRLDEYDVRPFMPVVRERDLDRIKEPLRKHTQEFKDILLNNWKDIEALADSLEGAKTTPKGRLMYETVVSGILLGGMIDALYEDKTLMPPPRRRGKNDRYYAWLVESNSEAAGKLKRELRESAGYRIVSIGTVLPDDKPTPDELRGKVAMLEEADARKYRAFIGVFSRDKLLPFFKNHREEFLKLGLLMSSGHDIAFGEFFAWYYNTMANTITDAFVADHRIAPPETYYTYAVKAPEQ